MLLILINPNVIIQVFQVSQSIFHNGFHYRLYFKYHKVFPTTKECIRSLTFFHTKKIKIDNKN